MNWFVFAVISWIFLGLDAGLSDVFQPFSLPVAPSFAHVLIVYVCLWAPSRQAYLASLIIGVAQDFASVVPASPDAASDVVVLGPHALGALLGASLVVNLRSVMIKRSALSMFIMTLFAAALLEIVVTAGLSVRSMYPSGIHFPNPSRELVIGLGSALYSAVLAIALSPPLHALASLFQFRTSGPAFPAHTRRP